MRKRPPLHLAWCFVAFLALAVAAHAQDEGTPDPVNVDRTLLASEEYLARVATAQDTPRLALTSLCDPAKIATLEGDRAANPRVRKIAYWLEVARREGRDPRAEIDAVMVAVGWGGTAKGDLTALAMVRNRVIAERLGCLDADGMERLRRGASPIVMRGPYAGEKLTVDHIIPRAVTRSLDLVLANLELMPHSLNIRKGAKIGQRQIDLANKLRAAGLLSDMDRQRVISRQTPGFVESE